MYYNAVRRAITFKQYYSVIVWSRFVWRNVEYMLMYWAEHLSEILKLFLENGIRLCIIDALICRMNIEQLLRLPCIHRDVFYHIPILWRHEKVARQRIHRATSNHSFITSVSYLVYLLTDMLLSLIWKPKIT